MMPVVRISDAAFGDLKQLSKWLETKTPRETIDKIIGYAMSDMGLERDSEALDESSLINSGATEFDNAPGLTFTKPLSASVNGAVVQNPRWRSVLHVVIAQVKAKGFEGDRLIRELNIPARAQRYENEGFRYYPDLGISVQGQSATDVWKEIDRLARKWHIPVKIEFWWRQNLKAQYPGRRGLLRSGTN
ncbi:T4SS efffector SepA family protein [Lichenibacterium ramalinae]|uniref:Uncharacterized protein n=1 Tax=Lichenibacterium ramalinae TaxID=2316527 RepID=A0A4Q2RDI5_9HYPH|nr:hypothetical protein D3272_09370 [Lichenibacterium ramalinae]